MISDVKEGNSETTPLVLQGDEKLDIEEYEKLVRKAMPGTVKWQV